MGRRAPKEIRLGSEPEVWAMGGVGRKPRPVFRRRETESPELPWVAQGILQPSRWLAVANVSPLPGQVRPLSQMRITRHLFAIEILIGFLKIHFISEEKSFKTSLIFSTSLDL